MKVIYLSGGIMNFCADEIHDWREESKKKIDPKFIVIDPTRISYKDRSASEVVELDKKDIDSSTHLLVYFIKPSVGTSMEVLYAWQNNKKVYLVNSTGERISPWLEYHSTKIFPSLEKAIKEINNE